MNALLFILIGLSIIAALIVAVPPLVRWTLRRSLPQVDGTIEVDGAAAPIEIRRDVDGVPHIFAASVTDAHFGLGFVHAQDRLWQMDLQRRFAEGRLSEIFGTRSLTADRFVRTLGLNRAAAAAWDALPSGARASVEAYTRGINACIARHGGWRRPPEFLLLRVTPEPWRPVDVLACTKLLALQLNFTYTADLLRAELTEAVGADRAAALLPFAGDAPPASAPTTTDRDRTPGNRTGGRRGDRAIDRAPIVPPGIAGTPVGGEGFGSNQWAVHGTRSATGAPVLASDPHLPTNAPSTWYLAHLCAGPLDAIGCTLPGVPGIAAGRNRHIAWGTSNVFADVQDLFRERLSPDGRRVQAGEEMEPLTRIDEVIHVRRRKPVTVTARQTRNGPLISDALNASRAAARRAGGKRARKGHPPEVPPPDHEPMALRWTALDPDDTTLSALLAVNLARNWNEFRDALRGFMAPPITFAYADAAGDIGLQIAGRVPVRASGDGTVPVDGWSGASAWVGAIPFDDLPVLHNPPEGLVVSANADNTPRDYPHFLGRPFVEPHRLGRITELLIAKTPLTLQDHLAIQRDTVSVQARVLLPVLLPLVEPQTPREIAAIDLLRAWDGDMRADSAAAAIFAALWLHLPRTLIEPDVVPRLYRALEIWPSCLDRFVRATLHDAQTTADRVERDRVARLAHDGLRQALDDLQRRLGPDLRTWRWGRIHRAVFAHQPFHMLPGLRTWFSRHVETGGDWSTINVGGIWGAAQPYEQRYLPGYRQVVDVSRPDGGQFVHALGQSGHVLSPHYDDYLADWAAGRLRPMRLERDAVVSAQRSLLTLRPRADARPSAP